MYIDNFIWLPDISEKLAVKHHVSEEEAEEVFFNRHLIIDSSNMGTKKEKMFTPPADRLMRGDNLIVFFIHKPKNTALILSARDMDKKERRRYEQR